LENQRYGCILIKLQDYPKEMPPLLTKMNLLARMRSIGSTTLLFLEKPLLSHVQIFMIGKQRKMQVEEEVEEVVEEAEEDINSDSLKSSLISLFILAV